MSAEEQIISSELLEQRKKVEQEYINCKALIDGEIPDMSFIWSPDGNSVNIIDDIFRKSKKIRELDRRCCR
jgi:hypothetical protein